MPTTNSGPSVSTFVNEVPLRGTFDPTGKLLQILGPGQTVAYDPANVNITGGLINGVSVAVVGASSYNAAAVAITGGTISGVSSVAVTGALSATGAVTATASTTGAGTDTINLTVPTTARMGWINTGNYYNWIECAGTAGTGNNYMRFAAGNGEVMRITAGVGLAVTGALSTTGGITDLTTLGAPAATGAVRSDFFRVQDIAGSRSLDQGISGSTAWIQSRDKNDFSVSYNLALQPNGGQTNFGGNVAVTGALSATGTISPQQAAAAPAYVKGAMYFDTTLNKLRIGGATAWETVTST